MADENKKSSKKRGATSKSSRTKAIGGFAWLAAGLMVGLFIAFLVFLQTKKDEPKVAKVEKSAEQTPSPDEPMAFDFYKKLPKMEVTVPDAPVKKPAPEPSGPVVKRETQTSPNKSAPTASADAAYVLQVGSFTQYEDADRQKASLAMMGISSKIVVVTTEKNEKRHRVQVGPFSNTGELNDTKKILAEHKIDVIVIKVRG